mmetsp:Transcript_68548/g.200528  ORF Transcript_68548/g.200528 Transcript_68548/m.200528 type:complete len:317 (+) Transcript_68548:1070-2020(+)
MADPHGVLLCNLLCERIGVLFRGCLRHHQPQRQDQQDGSPGGISARCCLFPDGLLQIWRRVLLDHVIGQPDIFGCDPVGHPGRCQMLEIDNHKSRPLLVPFCCFWNLCAMACFRCCGDHVLAAPPRQRLPCCRVNDFDLRSARAYRRAHHVAALQCICLDPTPDPSQRHLGRPKGGALRLHHLRPRMCRGRSSRLPHLCSCAREQSRCSLSGTGLLDTELPVKCGGTLSLAPLRRKPCDQEQMEDVALPLCSVHLPPGLQVRCRLGPLFPPCRHHGGSLCGPREARCILDRAGTWCLVLERRCIPNGADVHLLRAA